MLSKRMQEQVDGLLDQTGSAVTAMDWSRVMQAAKGVLAVDANNADARLFNEPPRRSS